MFHHPATLPLLLLISIMTTITYETKEEELRGVDFTKVASFKISLPPWFHTVKIPLPGPKPIPNTSDNCQQPDLTDRQLCQSVLAVTAPNSLARGFEILRANMMFGSEMSFLDPTRALRVNMDLTFSPFVAEVGMGLSRSVSGLELEIISSHLAALDGVEDDPGVMPPEQLAYEMNSYSQLPAHPIGETLNKVLELIKVEKSVYNKMNLSNFSQVEEEVLSTFVKQHDLDIELRRELDEFSAALKTLPIGRYGKLPPYLISRKLMENEISAIYSRFKSSFPALSLRTRAPTVRNMFNHTDLMWIIKDSALYITFKVPFLFKHHMELYEVTQSEHLVDFSQFYLPQEQVPPFIGSTRDRKYSVVPDDRKARMCQRYGGRFCHLEFIELSSTEGSCLSAVFKNEGDSMVDTCLLKTF